MTSAALAVESGNITEVVEIGPTSLVRIGGLRMRSGKDFLSLPHRCAPWPLATTL